MRECTEFARLRNVLKANGLRLSDIATVIGVTKSAVSNKLVGSRPWLTKESLAVTEYLRGWDPTLTVEDLFGPESNDNGGAAADETATASAQAA